MVDGGRLYTLDGMRGIAALCVAIYHFDYVGPHYLQAGYLAVDFFFALSGLVVAIAYGDRLRDRRLGIAAFAVMRVVRLYPLYLIGTVAGLLLLAAGVALDSVAAIGGGSGWRALGEVASALAMLPDPWSPLLLYPFNIPAWSLLYELGVNIAFAAVLVRLRTRWLALVWLVALAIYAVKVFHAWERGYGSNLGPYWQHWSAAGPRVLFGFTLGMLVHRLGWWRGRRAGWAALWPVAMLVFVLLAPAGAALDLLTIGAVIPATILLASRYELPLRLRGVCERLGDLSYPLYVVHFPAIFLVHALVAPLGPEPWGELLLFLVVALLAANGLIGVDIAIRSRLLRALRIGAAPGRAVPPAVGP